MKQLPVVCQLVETPERPLFQIKQQGGPHTLEHVGCNIHCQVLSLHGVETVPCPNITPILIPAYVTQWPTFNLRLEIAKIDV